VKSLIKFGCVGASGAVVNIGTLYILTAYAGLNYFIAYAISFVLAVTNNYIWNSIWTFEQSKSWAALGRYALVSTLTLSINESLLYLLSYKLGVWYMLSATLGIGAAFIINYILSRRIVWTRPRGIS